MITPIEKKIDLGDGRSITIETGKLAKQADGAVVVKMNNTYLLATVVSAKDAMPGTDFMPLSVEYKEKFSAIGRFPGGFMKREARPSDNEILVCRLVDRALRPLFPEDYHAETFVTIHLISGDKEDMPDALAGLAASAALAVSDVPFNGPISEVRVARVKGELVVNPTRIQIEEADMELVVGATIENILMVEGEMEEVSEQEMLEAMKVAHEAIKVQCKAQIELMEEVGKTEKRSYNHEENDAELKEHIKAATYDKVYEVAKAGLPKHERADKFAAIKEEYIADNYADAEEGEVPLALIGKYYHDVEKEAVRRCVLDERVRLDGRKTDEIRPIWSEVDYLPGPHGSAIFTRGETQSLSTVTLGTKLDEKIVDDVLNKTVERFLLHYNFPPFSTGDARASRGTSRREIGHGNLAFRALKNMLPDNYPYTIRIMSDILESNGSSSMATVCAGTLALMDAGVPIKKPVTGIAMGLITDENKNFAVLSDILGDEDHLGDMDFKVTGTRDGITATQMDIKVDGLSYEVLEKALLQAREGRLHIMDKIMETMDEPREDLKPHAPRIETINIPKDMIGAVIGPGGKIIQEIQATTESTITIEEDGDIGKVSVSADNAAAINAAMAKIKGIVAVPEVGEVYKGKIKSIVPFGAFVEILPGKEGLLHISEIEWKRLEKVEDVLKEGEEVEVKLIEVDQRSGKLKLSRKALLPRPERKSN
ncbi:polyribonucleotide nucleotidyltransferase [Saccharicrinis fermentans]|uniref:Polyribonucleotide nucleotidyltransferase n=1 Tax=Saccharicrinis fermentans DSM 9555 = JCM 21142 TaxID=869213 RepID=W7Y8G1_9BACT|nr:polyribonucleotide nucleotidyltransferase [Saccharicrinis fermentans]GAF03973.1 polyribonucleotide nucleotidyltransferase [Saccharicrinis fermentans DSM 9555 = JCM 21142]